ncbi:Piwi-domain-containing protein, partial [Cryphonectria parasitica EP155]
DSLPPRPSYGAEGTPIIVQANYVPLYLTPEAVLYKYKVDIEPKAVGRKAERVIKLLFQQNNLGGAATDFRAVIVRQKQEDNAKYNVKYFAEDEDEAKSGAEIYHVDVHLSHILSIKDFLAHLGEPSAMPYEHKDAMINALQTLFLHYFRRNNSLLTVGNKTFPISGPASKTQALGEGVAVYQGFFASVRPARLRPLVNVSVAYSAFYEAPGGNLASLISAFGSTDNYHIERLLRGLRIQKKFLKKRNKQGQEVFPTRKIFGLASPEDGTPKAGDTSKKSPPQVKFFGAGAKNVKFSTDDGWFTVYQYFEKQYGIRLQRPDLPVINIGSHEHPIYLPPEVCGVPAGQPVKFANLSSKQTSNMIKFTCNNPIQNFRLLTEYGLKAVGFSDDPDSVLVKFMKSDADDLSRVRGRTLNKPRLVYGDRTLNVARASWNLMGQKLSCPNNATKSWGWVYVRIAGQNPAYESINTFLPTVMEFQDAMLSYGIRLNKSQDGRDIARACILQNQNDPALETSLEAFRGKDLVWVIVPAGSKLLYDRIKYLSDVKLGVMTVVSVDKTLKERDPRYQSQYLGNEALKVNLKLGGMNQRITSGLHFISEGKTMLVGIDVIHPSTDQTRGGMPSVAGMVATVDRHVAQWPGVLQVQQKRQEMVSDLEPMLIACLNKWKQANNGTLPENILVYRDGVSEGQHQEVRKHELPLLRAACQAVYPPASQGMGLPRITIVIVAKRHHTRFAPGADGACDKTFNCEAGLVVDSGITELASWNFYLQAHSAIKGHARPGFYTVVHDEIFRWYKPANSKPTAADVLQEVSQSLCYAFGRATRAVGICTPAYYADILCERAGCYLRAFEASEASGGIFSRRITESSELTDEDMRRLQREMETHDNLKARMIYI